jgi:hypothetical protein
VAIVPLAFESVDERVAVSAGVIKLIAGSRTLDSAAVSDIRKLVWTAPADALFHGDERYYVAFLSDRVWVVPYFAGGVRGFLEALGAPLAAQGALFSGEISGCPLPWRRRVLGLLPLFPMPALGSHPLHTVPEFVSIKPASVDDIQEGASANA